MAKDIKLAGIKFNMCFNFVNELYNLSYDVAHSQATPQKINIFRVMYADINRTRDKFESYFSIIFAHMEDPSKKEELEKRFSQFYDMLYSIQTVKCDVLTSSRNGISETPPTEQMSNAYVLLERVKVYNCNECTRGFLNHEDSSLHQLQHQKFSRKSFQYINNNKEFIKPYKCEECGRAFVLESNLKLHSALHAPYPHICHCGVGYYSDKTLLAHKKIVHPKVHSTTQASQKNKEVKIDNITSKSQKRPNLKAKLKWKSKLKNGVKRSRSSNNHKKDSKIRPVQCPICQKIFDRKEKLAEHIREHTGPKGLTCEICNKKYSQTVTLRLHLLRHAGFKDEQCQYCEKTFLGRRPRELHERTHTGVKPHQCKYCMKAFSDPSAYARHLRIHTGEKPYICETCDKAFSDYSAYAVHRMRHMGIKKFPCNICTRKFYTKSMLNHHTLLHTQEKYFECDHCQKSYSSKSNLISHISNMHLQRKGFKCKRCDERFSCKVVMKKHYETVHTSRGHFYCDQCGKHFTLEDKLKIHKRTVYCSLVYQCNDCGMQYRWRNSLLYHIVTKHLNIKCEMCSTYFKCTSDLRKHINSKQCGKRLVGRKKFSSVGNRSQHDKSTCKRKSDFQSNKCDKKYPTKSQLPRRYSMNDDTKKVYECDHCKKSFPIKMTLQYHIMSRHLEALYCYICKRPFYSECDYKHHMRNRCVRKNFPCEICNKVLTSRYHFEIHSATHARMPKY